MFHADTQFLIDLWAGLARRPGVRGGIPARAAFAPEALGVRLPRAFMLDGVGPQAAFRLAGGSLEALQDRPLAGRPFLDLWTDASRALVVATLCQSVREARPVVIVAHLDGVQSEWTLVPLRRIDGRPDVVLGLFAPPPHPDLAAGPRRFSARVAIGVGDQGRPALSVVPGRGAA